MINYGLNNVKVLLQDTNKTFPMQILFSTGGLSLPTSVTVGVFLGSGNDTFSNQTTYSTGSNSSQRCIAVAYFNKISHLDITVYNFLIDTICISFFVLLMVHLQMKLHLQLTLILGRMPLLLVSSTTIVVSILSSPIIDVMI